MWRRIIPFSILLLISAWLVYGRTHIIAPACRLITLDVGQGDAILIQTSDQQDILIDGGPDNVALEKLNKYLPAGDRDIELMVLTHPHADHVNGLVPITERYQVKRALNTGLTFSQLAYEKWKKLLNDRGVPIELAQAGQRHTIGQAQLEILWPGQDLSKVTYARDNASQGGGVNDASIVIRLSCGGSQAMLMGDAGGEIEERIIASGSPVQADLLKVGHHGSRYSTSVGLVDAVKPKWAVLSVGLGNTFNHPHPTSLLHLAKVGAAIFRTDQLGDVKFITDGNGGWENY